MNNIKNTMRQRAVVCLCGAVLLLAAACATSGGSGAEALSLDEAVKQSAAVIAEKLPPGTRVAIVAFEAEHENLAGYMMDELTGELVNSSLEVADRSNLAFVLKELNLHMSGMVDDASAADVGKFLGAEYVITGQMVNIGGAYRWRVNAITVETAKHTVSERHTVRNDRAAKNLVAALRKSKPVVREAGYGAADSAEAGSAAPATAGAFLDRGIIFATRGDYELAIEDFTEAINLKPDLYSAWMLRGRALYASMSKVTSVGENFSTIGIYENLSASTEQQAVYDRALADFNQAIQLEPNSAKAHYERSVVYLNKGDYDRAIADCSQAIKLDPNDAADYNNRGIAYSRKGEYNRAIADYTQAIKLDPNYAMPYYNRGLEYANKGDYDRAIADYTQAIRIDPNDADAYHGRGIAYEFKGDYDRAIADYTQVIRLNPNHARGKNNLERARRARGR
jgi:tetratricopeptide (TPR) repeat protein